MMIRELLGKRCLVKTRGSSQRLFSEPGIREVRFEEVSPSGNWVKLVDMHGRRDWIPVADVLLLEELIPLHGGEPNPRDAK